MSPTTKPTKPLDIYVRVSQVGGRDGDSFISPVVQEERCRAQLVANGYEAGEVFTDLDRTGKVMARPAFDKAMARALGGESGGIIVYKLSRFGRNVVGVLKGIADIEAAGGAFVSVDPKVDTSTPGGRFVLTLFAALDEMEVDNITAGWGVVHENMIERGIHSGSYVPAGYSKGPDKRLIVNGHSQDITDVFRFRSNGANWSQVAAFLTERKVPNQSGKPWTGNAARKLIANRVYLGEARHGDKVKIDAHPRLVDADIFTFANHKERRVSGERGNGPLLGGGLCRCGKCGAGLVKTGKTVGGKPYEYLRCMTKGAGHATVAVALAEPFIVAAAEAAAAALPTEDEAIQSVADASIAVEKAQADVAELAAREWKSLAAKAEAMDEAHSVLEAAETWLTNAYSGLNTTPDWDDVPAARSFLKEMLGAVIVSPGRAPFEERVRITGPLGGVAA